MIYIFEALSVFRANIVRTGLTSFGIIIGVASIVTVQILGSGVAVGIDGVIKGLNVNTLFVYPKGLQRNTHSASLSMQDVERLQSDLPNVAAAEPMGEIYALVRAGHQRVRLRVVAESDHRFSTAPVALGRTLDSADIALARSVCVLSGHSAQRLFPSEPSPIGESIHFNGRRYEVVGVLAPTVLSSSLLGFDVSGDISIPYTNYYYNFARNRPLLGIRVLVKDGQDLSQVGGEITSLLSETHNNSRYETFDFASAFAVIARLVNAVTLVVELITAITLLVAGVGVMNVMLASIFERLKEVGIRRAVGASKLNIIRQFSIESILLCVLGALFGEILGLCLGMLLNDIVIVRISGTPATVPWLRCTLIALSFGVGTGAFFGVYPAFRAAAIDPIYALRSE